MAACKIETRGAWHRRRLRWNNEGSFHKEDELKDLRFDTFSPIAAVFNIADWGGDGCGRWATGTTASPVGNANYGGSQISVASCANGTEVSGGWPKGQCVFGPN